MPLHIYKDVEELNNALAEWITDLIAQTLKVKSRFTIALSGGNTPKSLYKKLSSSSFKEKTDWSKVHFFWGDERVVPFEDERNNAKMAYENLLDNVQVTAAQIHVMRTDIDPELSSNEYEKILHNYFDDGTTTFDLVLLGMGEDGHTLSLFPGSPLLKEEDRWVKEVYAEDQKMFRITLMPSVVNRAGSVVFLITGSDKTKTLQKVLEDDYQPEKFPSQLIKPANGQLYWFLDEAASKDLKSIDPQV